MISRMCVELLFQMGVVIKFLLLEVSWDSQHERMLCLNVKMWCVPDWCTACAGGQQLVLQRLVGVVKSEMFGT